MIKDTLNPDFVRPFAVDYYFEESQKIRFEVWVHYMWNLEIMQFADFDKMLIHMKILLQF